MKKLLPALLVLIMSFTVHAHELVANAAYIKDQMTRDYLYKEVVEDFALDYYKNLHPASSHDIGISYGNLVMTSVEVYGSNHTLFNCSGFQVINGKVEFMFWTDHIVGVSGTNMTINSMTGYANGDRVLINAGFYTAGGFFGMHDITILPNTTRPSFTGEMGFRNCKNVDWGFGTSTGFLGNGMDMRAYGISGNPADGPDVNCSLHNWAFLDLQNQCIDGNGGYLHTKGDTTTFMWYKCSFDSIYERNCTRFCQGSFGSPGDNTGRPPNVMCLTTITRLLVEATSATNEEGTEIRGIQLECNYHDWTVTSVTQRAPTGDVGLIYGHINGDFWNIYKNGGPGYLVRASPVREVGRPGHVSIYNNCKINGTEYGLSCLQSPDTVTIAGVGAYGNIDSVNIYNNTGIHMLDQINYWCQLLVGGTRSTDGIHFPRWQVRNNIGIDIADKASGGTGHDGGTFTQRIVFNQGETWTTETADTSNNAYYTSVTAAGLDSTFPQIINAIGSFPQMRPVASSTVRILTLGTAQPLSGFDIAGVPRTSKVMGYRELALPTGLQIIIHRKAPHLFVK